MTTLTKAEILESLHLQEELPKNKTEKTLESLLEIIKTNLSKKENLLISGFGKFTTKKKESRKGRNPSTGETIYLPSRKVVTFKPSNKLRKKMNP